MKLSKFTIEDIKQVFRELITCCCSNVFRTTTLSPPVDAPGAGDPVVLFNNTTGIYYYWDGDSWETLSSGGGGDFYFSVTRSEAETLISADALVPGTLYKITDRGDNGIFLQAISTNQFSNEGVRAMLVPMTYDLTNIAGWRGMWRYTQEAGWTDGDYVIWDAHVYSIVNVLLINNTPPSSNFAAYILIPKTSFSNSEYKEKMFGIIYDWENDWISEQWDDKDNHIIVNKSYASLLTAMTIDYSYQGIQNQFIDQTDWDYTGHVDVGSDPIFSNNIIKGVIKNNFVPTFENYPRITDNQTGGIEGNESSRIFSNITGGSISFNLGNGYINNNVVAGTINSNNTSNNNIEYNTINGQGIDLNDMNGGIGENISTAGIISNGNNVAGIYNNIADGIVQNNNGGSIEYNVVTGTLSSNTNSGSITHNKVSIIQNNTNSGGINYNYGSFFSSNSNGGQIIQNSCPEGLFANSNVGEVSYNSIPKFIAHNSGIGDIIYNTNKGFIDGNTKDVLFNSNSGDIDTNTGIVAYNKCLSNIVSQSTDLYGDTFTSSDDPFTIPSRDGNYIFNGTTATWTIPSIGTVAAGVFNIINAGSGDLTIVTTFAINEIWNGSAVNTITIPSGQTRLILITFAYYYIN